MQFIEKNSFNVRSAVYLLKNEDSKTEFLIFPMVHIGSKEFYSQISKRLSECDLILAEGVDSKKANILTLAYRAVKGIKRMDLITQKEGIKISSFKDKIINSDMKEKNFDENWSTLSIFFRMTFFIIVPVYVIYLFIFGTREIIAKNIAFEDLPNSDEILDTDEDIEKMDEILIDKRDKILIDHIEKVLSNSGTDKKTIGILYGASHMRNVFNYLLGKKEYKIAKSEWVVVFDL